MPQPNLTLIVAATSHLGIGLSGGLPWRIRAEMAYFARVTKRVAPSPTTGTPTTASTESTPPIHANAVIMGRKTWSSIPPKFRPLPGRVNIVITRQPRGQLLTSAASGDGSGGDTEAGIWGPHIVNSLDEALALITGSSSTTTTTPPSPLLGKFIIEKIFVIGGAEIYNLALQHPWTKRILLTEVAREGKAHGEGAGERNADEAGHGDSFKCDTFFPEFRTFGKGWNRRSQVELSQYIGEEVPEGPQTEKDVKFEYQLWEKEI